jgi:DNA-nicking Smr family endonuclease
MDCVRPMKRPHPLETMMTRGQNAFKQLRALVQQAGMRLESAPDPPVPPKPAQAEALPQAETDEEIFRRATEGVNRASWRHISSPSSPPAPPELKDPEDEARKLMEAAVNGDPALSVPDHPEYIEGWIGISGKRFLPGLRNGLYSIQEQIDLHGFSREEARWAVEDFIARASRFRSCCVKIIHGRGINSPNDKAVLKESLQQWLSTRRMSRHVVAYASAPLKDGGVGAIYVLLKQSNG